MANYMAEVAKMLGLKIGERFKVAEENYWTFYLDINGVRAVKSIGDESQGIVHTAALRHLLNGEYTIVKLPWKPKENEIYYFYQIVEKKLRLMCDHYGKYCVFDIANYHMGNCFKTEKEALQNRSKIKNLLSEVIGEAI